MKIIFEESDWVGEQDTLLVHYQYGAVLVGSSVNFDLNRISAGHELAKLGHSLHQFSVRVVSEYNVTSRFKMKLNKIAICIASIQEQCVRLVVSAEGEYNIVG